MHRELKIGMLLFPGMTQLDLGGPEERVVVDRDRITGGGVTAGIDFGLVVAAKVFGPTVAQEIQLAIEYAPSPPYECGLPGAAPATIRDAVLLRARDALSTRESAVRRAAARLT